MLLILYWIMTLCCCLYATSAGGTVGRIGAGIIIFKTVAGFCTSILDQSWSHTLYPVLAVDAMVLVVDVDVDVAVLGDEIRRYVWLVGVLLTGLPMG